MATLNQLNQRISALEKILSPNNFINVFIRRFGEEVPVTRAKYGDLIIEKLPGESHGDFRSRTAREAQKVQCDGFVRVFELWLADGE